VDVLERGDHAEELLGCVGYVGDSCREVRGRVLAVDVHDEDDTGSSGPVWMGCRLAIAAEVVRSVSSGEEGIPFLEQCVYFRVVDLLDLLVVFPVRDSGAMTVEFEAVYVELEVIFMTPDIMYDAFALSILFAPECRCPIQAILLRRGRVLEVVECRQDVAFSNDRRLSSLCGRQRHHCGLMLNVWWKPSHPGVKGALCAVIY